jgi:signal transduction histidine kinase
MGTLVTHLIRFHSGVLGDNGPFAFIGIERVMPLIFFLTIPMIVIAWQYSFRWVVFYALSLALVDLSIALVLRLLGDVYGTAWVLGQLAIGRTVILLANGYLVSRLVASQRQQRAALAQANRRLVQYALTQEQLTVSRERNRMARDLHDTLAHYMSGLVLELEGTRLLWDADSPQARTTLDNAITTARNGLVETRRALQALRSTPLADLGFNRAVRELAESMAARNQWQLQLDLPAMTVVLPSLVEEVLYRIIQEGLTNVERHADATQVTLTLHLVDDALQLVLTDDGRGFAPAEAKTADKFGLLGMKERSDLIDGALRIDSAPGRGVTLRLTLPNQPASTLAQQRLSPMYDDGKVAISV